MIRNRVYTETRLQNYWRILKLIIGLLIALIPFAFAQISHFQDSVMAVASVGAVVVLLIFFFCFIWLINNTTQDLKEVKPTDSKAQPNTNEQSLGGDLSQVDLQAQINLRGTVDIKALKPNSAPPPANSQAEDSSNASETTDASTSAESQPDSPNETKPTENDLK